jgi:hypothetical protein
MCKVVGCVFTVSACVDISIVVDVGYCIREAFSFIGSRF